MSGEAPIDHECETGVAPTELGGAIVETGPQLAYSEELPALDYPEPVSRARVALIAGSIVAVAGLMVGAVLFVGHSRRADPTPLAATPSSTMTLSTTPTPIAAPPPAPPPPPVTVTTVVVQAPPTVATKAPPRPSPTAAAMPTWLVEADNRFLAKLYADGWRGGDPSVLTRTAHWVCLQFSKGVDPATVNNQLVAGNNITMSSALEFTSTAMLTYPNCP